jgi:hypothetical protein
MFDMLEMIKTLRDMQRDYNEGELRNWQFESQIQSLHNKLDKMEQAMMADQGVTV